MRPTTLLRTTDSARNNLNRRVGKRNCCYKDAIDTGDAFLIEEKLQQLADEL